MKKLIITAFFMAIFPTIDAFSQEEKKQEKPIDSIKPKTKIVESDTKEEKTET
ncbi:hypothetical protein [Flavobacterium gyeonganense]|uniref:hypothetical protein n=1 Tax=Flavobacterium gyeonganense TaxID=1310418 RepID=UPI002414576C|nr:hypothetical protein [Flavobacterium gyeonganense]